VTLVGTVTPLAVLSLANAIARPPVGAALEIVTVPVELAPPTTDVGLNVKPVMVGAVTVRPAEALRKPAVAMTVVAVFVETGTVPTVTWTEVWPAGIVTDGGVISIPVGTDDSVTVRLEAIGLPRVRVPVTPLPPITVFALRVRLSESGRTVIVSVAALPLEGIAVITGDVCAATTFVAMVIVWLVLPAGKLIGVCGEAD